MGLCDVRRIRGFGSPSRQALAQAQEAVAQVAERIAAAKAGTRAATSHGGSHVASSLEPENSCLGWWGWWSQMPACSKKQADYKESLMELNRISDAVHAARSQWNFA